jgi:ribosomal protein L37AE/L43A
VDHAAPSDDQNRVTTPIQDRVDRHEEFTSASKKCPECGEPIENVRATCPHCGYEYADTDYDEDDQTGREFVAGEHVDEEGNEVLDPCDEGEGPDTSAPSDSGSGGT